MTAKLFRGDCRALMARLPESSVDAIVTDPPYDLTSGSGGGGFMGQKWDATGIAFDPELWRLALRVLKPGGHLLAFGGTRTYHRMTCAIEDAGFEIRDSLHWVYFNGFPKSLDISKALDKAAGAQRAARPGANIQRCRHIAAGRPCSGHGDETSLSSPTVHVVPTLPATAEAWRWAGWGTALKPAHEPIVLARKPLIGTLVANVRAHGVGGLNIGACRVGVGKRVPTSPSRSNAVYGDLSKADGSTSGWDPGVGRWPPNILFQHAPGCVPAGTVDAPAAGGAIPKGSPAARASVERRTTFAGHDAPRGAWQPHGNGDGTETVAHFNCAPGCPVAAFNAGEEMRSRFFSCATWEPDELTYDLSLIYAAKAPRSEREAGCEALPARTGAEAVQRKEGAAGTVNPRAGAGGRAAEIRCFHPTVKSIAIMRHLVRLVTPPGGLVLDPFLGSGTTGCAAALEGARFVGAELDPDYMRIAQARITYWTAKAAAAAEES